MNKEIALEFIPRFYSVIIGTELLNGRRKDAHFEFLNKELIKRGFDHVASFVIYDIPELIEATFRLIKSDINSVMFCFGGIGATPDDYTRDIAALVFRDGVKEYHHEAKRIIEERFKERAYPNRIEMANLPIGSKLLENPINQVPGFYLDDRFFFTPGFPEMAHPMVLWALNRYFSVAKIKHKATITIKTSEESLIDFMKTLSKEIELSSLPAWQDGYPIVTISLSGYDESLVKSYFENLVKIVQNRGWEHHFGEPIQK